MTPRSDQRSAIASISTGVWTLVQWKYDGTNIKIRVNSDSWVTGDAAGNIHATGLTQAVAVGKNYDGSAFADLEILDLGLTDSVLSDTAFDIIKSYINFRYGLSL